MLLFEARRAGPAREGVIAAEFARRLSSGALSARNYSAAVDFAVTRLVDDTAPIEPDWCELILHAWRSNQLSIAQYVACLQAIIEISASGRERVTWDDLYTLIIEPDLRRWPLRELPEVVLDIRATALALDGEPIDESQRDALQSTLYMVTGVRGPSYGFSGGGSSFRAGKIAGERSVQLQLRVGLVTVTDVSDETIQDFQTPPPALASWLIDHELSFTVLPEGESAVQLTIDDSLHDDVHACITVGSAILSPLPRGGSELYVRLHIQDAPMNLSFTVHWPHAEQEHRLGSVSIGPMQSATRTLHMRSRTAADLRELSVIDLILRPNQRSSAVPHDVEEIWGEDIVIRDVPVTWQETRPTNPNFRIDPVAP